MNVKNLMKCMEAHTNLQLTLINQGRDLKKWNDRQSGTIRGLQNELDVIEETNRSLTQENATLVAHVNNLETRLFKLEGTAAPE